MNSDGANASNVTGIWHGLYTYPRIYPRVLFDATLIETATRISGSSTEISSQGPLKGQTVFAELLGQRSGSSIIFRKTCHWMMGHPGIVDYSGALSEDGLEIEGKWTIPGNWSGKFLMIRSQGKPQAAERKVFERI